MENDHQGMLLRLPDFVNGYVTMVRSVMELGAIAAPRGAITREVLGATLAIDASGPMLPVKVGRGVNPKLATVEALQVIGGYSDPAELVEVNPHLEDFMDQGAFHGAYGPRIRGQMDLVLRRLRDDPFTRRAVVTIWDPARDAIEGVKNYPCTTELQFMVRTRDREGRDPSTLALDMHVTMRANDAWHGLGYDAFVFNQLQWSVANALGLPVGTYYHHATSLHVYREHWDLVDKLQHVGQDEVPEPLYQGVGTPACATFDDRRGPAGRARAIANCEKGDWMTASERAYFERLWPSAWSGE